ncbi:MAG: hypothetical protein CSB44_08155 [Gammaproteobacteria bacterium]|nr:MAG: hypothetical protein CSB44_08155 [Gammaproteobacteria bacterium]PIE36897.1 MAG: hypothetical protein CSA54_02895 [Gammaproteobacteria bacterium]
MGAATCFPGSLAAALILLVSCSGQGGTPQSEPQSQPPAAAPALPASEVDNAFPDTDQLSLIDAYRLLDQTTFGPALAEIEAAADMGPGAWIDRQMQLPATYLLPLLMQSDRSRWNEYVNTWWRRVIQSDDQLRHRVAFALSEIFVVSASDGLGEEQEGLANYYDILLRHAFGNYRELIEDITLNPIMGEFLSMKGNQGPDPERNIQPDENYARELLQLFSIGLVRLNPDGTPILDDKGVPVPTYDQEIVEGFARVFTGWHFANAEDFRWPDNTDYLSPMTAWPEYHASGRKTLLRGRVLEAGGTPEDDLEAALDNIANDPNTGPFLSKQLIQRLVTSNPSPGYVRDVAAVWDSNASGERGNLGSVIKAILMHREARLGHLESPESFGKLKEPLLRVAHLWRAFEPASIHHEFNYAWAESDLAQAPLYSPTVFNFFRPDYAPPGEIADAGLVAPEFEIHDDSSIIRITTRLLANSLWLHNHDDSKEPENLYIDIDREMALEPDQDALIAHLDLLLTGGRMSEALRNDVRALLAERPWEDEAATRVAEAIFLVITSPEAAVQI